uniref:DNA ligase (NAD(+)) n=1 Tax=viral metagenome TaxID=1070528 RepID=A0A6M3IHI1_9ZZZZ
MDDSSILKRQIKYHRKKYYGGEPEISDREFDKLISRLKEIDPDAQELQEVGALPKRRKIALPFILGSLDNKNITNVLKWMEKQDDDVMMSWKLDGVSVIAKWINTKLHLFATRGDGEYGEDILFKAKWISNLPKIIPDKKAVCARGEALISIVPATYKTRRSAAIGIMNRDDDGFMHLIKVMFYELIEPGSYTPKTEEERFSAMEKLGLNTAPSILIRKDEIDEKTLKFLEGILDKKATYDYDIDGLVLAKNKQVRENVKVPKNKVALKMDMDAIVTEVKEIEWNTTRTGLIVPVVHVEATEINGIEIEGPTGHNWKWITDRKIDVGAVIEIIRAGDVIPYIREVIKPARKLNTPTECPICKKSLSTSGPNLICTNPKCAGAQIAQLEYFLRTLGAEQIAFATVKKLWDELKVRTIQDIYELTKKNISLLGGFGDTSAETIIEEIKRTLTAKRSALLAAFGIHLIGLKTAIKILEINGLQKFSLIFKAPKNVLYSKLIAIQGIGPSIAESFSENIHNYKEAYDFLKSKGLKFHESKKTNKLGGQSFQFTGTMSKERDEMEMLTINNGGRLASVSKRLDFLVTNDKSSPSTKARKARELQIKMITEKQFLEMMA